MMSQQAQIKPERLTWIELTPTADQATAQKRTQAQEEALRRQIVQTEAGEESEKAAKDAFLGAKTQVVDRQLVSRNRTTVISKAQQTARRALQPRAQEAELPEPRKGALANLGLPILPKAMPKKSAMAQQESGDDLPQWANLGAAPQDYVKGITEGDRTALNTKQYVFYGYFQRIRERLDRAWVPILRSKLMAYYRTGRRLASDMDHTTRLLVILNPQGEIVRVQVMSESGTRDLDDAAVSAFNKAGPFPNPPQGIVDPNGEIQIPWEFVLRG